MNRIIDLGNGYGRLEGYDSKYASLIFPLTFSRVRWLHAMGYIDDDELRTILLSMGYDLSVAKLSVALGKVKVATREEVLRGMGSI